MRAAISDLRSEEKKKCMRLAEQVCVLPLESLRSEEVILKKSGYLQTCIVVWLYVLLLMLVINFTNFRSHSSICYNDTMIPL